MGRRMRDYIHLDESEVKEWHCFKKEREMFSSQEDKTKNTERKEG